MEFILLIIYNRIVSALGGFYVVIGFKKFI